MSEKVEISETSCISYIMRIKKSMLWKKWWGLAPSALLLSQPPLSTVWLLTFR